MTKPQSFVNVSSLEDLIHRCAEISATRNGLMFGIETFDQTLVIQKLISPDENNIVIPILAEIIPRTWEYGATKQTGKIVLQGSLSLKFDLSGWVLDEQ